MGKESGVRRDSSASPRASIERFVHPRRLLYGNGRVGFIHGMSLSVVGFLCLSVIIQPAPTQVESEWFFEQIEAGGDFGIWSSVFIDSMNIPHVSYFDAADGNLKYAMRLDGMWTVETIDATGSVGSWNVLTLDSKGLPLVAYESIDSHELRFAHRNESRWTTEAIHGGGAHRHVSLSADQNDDPHIVFYTENDRSLLYASRSRGTWMLERIDSDSYGSSIALDSSGGPHISYFDADDSRIVHTQKEAGSWQYDTVSSVSEFVTSTGIAIDRDDRVHIVFVDSGDLIHITAANEVALKEIIDCGLDSPIRRRLTVSVDPTAGIHLAYLKRDTLFYAHYDQGKWVIDKLREASISVSMATDLEGWPHVVFYHRDKDPGPNVIGDLWYGSRRQPGD
jgi:hypothetical protein